MSALDPTGNLDAEEETPERFRRYNVQRRNRGLLPVDYGSWLRDRQPLFDDDVPRA